MRVLEWIIGRCEGRAGARETFIGAVPGREDFDLTGLEGFTDGHFARATAVDPGEWRRETEGQGELFARLGARVPSALIEERERLRARLGEPGSP